MAGEYDPQRFDQWAKDHGGAEPCVCGGTEWVTGAYGSGIPRLKERKVDIPQGYEVVPRYCARCGFIRLYAREPFKQASVPNTNGH